MLQNLRNLKGSLYELFGSSNGGICFQSSKLVRERSSPAGFEYILRFADMFKDVFDADVIVGIAHYFLHGKKSSAVDEIWTENCFKI